MNIFFTAFEVFKLADLSSYCTSIYYILYISERDSNDDVLFTILSKMKNKNKDLQKYCTYHEPSIPVVDP
jgi:hypothetical protein